MLDLIGALIGFIFTLAIIFLPAFLFFYIFLYKIVYVKIIKRLIDIKERKVNAEIESLRAKSKAE